MDSKKTNKPVFSVQGRFWINAEGAVGGGAVERQIIKGAIGVIKTQMPQSQEYKNTFFYQ